MMVNDLIIAFAMIKKFKKIHIDNSYYEIGNQIVELK